MNVHYFIDGVQRSRENPTTFRIPTYEEKESIKVGDYVKVGANNVERFWTKVERIENGIITAVVDNDLVYTQIHGLACGDEVKFEFKHILDILK